MQPVTREKDGRGKIHVSVLAVGGREYQNFDPIVKDLRGVGSSGVELIMGIDVMKQSNLTIDYAARKVRFASSFREPAFAFIPGPD